MNNCPALNAARRSADLARLGDTPNVDVLVIGGGITGVGIALDAASRGLSVALVEKHDLAFGTSRWSSKLIHGGLRYLASGNWGIAHRCAVERALLMTHNAPHLVTPLPHIVALYNTRSRSQRALIRTGLIAGDVLGIIAGHGFAVLPRSHRITTDHATELIPALRRDGLSAPILAYDGHLIDDARLVVTVARTAAQYGARILTRVSARNATGNSALLTDEITGATLDIRARTVINATGVWAADIDPAIRLRPSRGTHLVFDAATFGNPTAALTIPVPGEINRFVFAIPEQLGRVYLGLTDEPAPGLIPDVPQPSAAEITFLLNTINTALQISLTPNDIRGAYAGLRPLIDTGADDLPRTADISRNHAVYESDSGVYSIVGGKLTEYRLMACDVLHRALTGRGIVASPCRTRNLPLIGAPSKDSAGSSDSSLVMRYGAEAPHVITSAQCARPTDTVAEGIDVLRAEFEFAITHEGALTIDDILDRRTRIGLVPEDRERAIATATELLSAAR